MNKPVKFFIIPGAIIIAAAGIFILTYINHFQATTTHPASTFQNTPSPVNTTKPLTYEIINSVFIERDINIKYPQISMSDKDKQKKINAALQKDAFRIIDDYPKNSDVTIKIDFTVKWSGANLLSISYSGSGFEKGNSYPESLFYTSNINIDDGSIIKLSNVINIDANLAEIFKDKISQTNKGILDADSNNEVAALLKDSGTCCYFTSDSVGLSLDVPHAAGDHKEFEIKYSDISKYMNGSIIWKDFK